VLSDRTEETIQALHALAEPAARRRILRWAAEDRRRRSPVSGTDLVAVGLSGPDVGRALARIRAAFLDGELANREEAIALAQEIARRAQTKRPTRKKPGSRRKPQKRRPKGPSDGPKKVAADSPIADTEP
jgi:hypothetical protein